MLRKCFRPQADGSRIDSERDVGVAAMNIPIQRNGRRPKPPAWKEASVGSRWLLEFQDPRVGEIGDLGEDEQVVAAEAAG